MSLSFITLWFSVLFLGPLPEAEPKSVTIEIPAVAVKSSAFIPWSVQKKLTWEDFSGEPSPENHHHALTSTNMEMKAKWENNQLKFKVDAVFNPAESWTRNRNSSALLAHEQLHFDLTELHARMLRKKLSEVAAQGGRGSINLNKFANQAFENWHKEQEQYDHECRHGLNKEKQQEWIDSVEARLLELAEYAS
ncbi:DUF922 domain-containing protein [Rufibacter roseus]|uniref:DUF922 domain-containing protein n=1 Tax=Rufibacter roseus TaxID=1567108 RepID=A0ABW2DU39_9BACT|nr:DUF922 domain-containing protein [Rufibacter roseus]